MKIPTKTQPTVQAATPAPAVREEPPFRDRTPSNWDVREGPMGVLCVNSRTGERFEGPMAEFNRRMRG